MKLTGSNRNALVHFKHYICKHIIGICILFKKNGNQMPLSAKSIPIGKKRKAGRLRQAVLALFHQRQFTSLMDESLSELDDDDERQLRETGALFNETGQASVQDPNEHSDTASTRSFASASAISGHISEFSSSDCTNDLVNTVFESNVNHLSNTDNSMLQTATIRPNSHLESTAFLDINKEINEFTGLSESFLANESYATLVHTAESLTMSTTTVSAPAPIVRRGRPPISQEVLKERAAAALQKKVETATARLRKNEEKLSQPNAKKSKIN